MDSSLAYSEVYEILKLIEDKYRERIPKNVTDFFEKERDKEYIPVIDVSIPLDEQNLKRETMVLLAILNLNYWCDSEEEKEEILKEFKENARQREIKKKEIEEKYNPDNIFKKKETFDSVAEVSIIEYKEQNFIQKLILKIKKIFRRSN